MRIDSYESEDVFARMPELASQTDPVLVQLDQILDDDTLYQRLRADLARRYRLTPVHGRRSTPAEVVVRLLVVRLLVVQHLYAWSYQETVERVADSLVLRWFCRVYFQQVPDKTTLLRWAHTIRPETLQLLIDQTGRLARQANVTTARKLRIDSTCVQTTVHHPTDSGLLGDGVRVLSRLLRHAKPLVEARLAGVRGGRETFRSHLRTVRRLLQQLRRMRRQQGEDAAEQQLSVYQQLLDTTRQTVRQAQRVVTALRAAPQPDAQLQHQALRLHTQFARILPLVERVVAQARSQVLDGVQVPATQKVLSLFEPHTRVVMRHKLRAAVEFGRQVVFDEIDGGIITCFHGLADGESVRHQALPALRHHDAVFGHAPLLLTGDRGLHTKGVEAEAQALGVRQVVIPRSGPTTTEQGAREHDPRWQRRYRWRAGIEGRIHSLRRDYGLARVRSHGEQGLEQDIGWGVFASDLRRLATAQVRRRRPSPQRAA